MILPKLEGALISISEIKFIFTSKVQMLSCLVIKRQKQPPEVFCKKVVLRNFVKFTGKLLCHSLFLNKVAGLRPKLLKKRLRHRCFPVNLVKFLRTSFFTEHLWWLLLKRICEFDSYWEVYERLRAVGFEVTVNYPTE